MQTAQKAGHFLERVPTASKPPQRNSVTAHRTATRWRDVSKAGRLATDKRQRSYSRSVGRGTDAIRKGGRRTERGSVGV